MRRHEVTFILCSIPSSHTGDTAASVQQDGDAGPPGEEESGSELQPGVAARRQPGDRKHRTTRLSHARLDSVEMRESSHWLLNNVPERGQVICTPVPEAGAMSHSSRA